MMNNQILMRHCWPTRSIQLIVHLRCSKNDNSFYRKKTLSRWLQYIYPSKKNTPKFLWLQRNHPSSVIAGSFFFIIHPDWSSSSQFHLSPSTLNNKQQGELKTHHLTREQLRGVPSGKRTEQPEISLFSVGNTSSMRVHVQASYVSLPEAWLQVDGIFFIRPRPLPRFSPKIIRKSFPSVNGLNMSAPKNW